MNSARVKIAENHLGNCNEIFAVCPIGRAGTDAGVEAVFSLAERANLSRVGIICTKSDVRLSPCCNFCAITDIWDRTFKLRKLKMTGKEKRVHVLGVLQPI